MTLEELLKDKTLKPKDKPALIAQRLLEGSLQVDEVLEYAAHAKASEKAGCIEALEYATRQEGFIATEEMLPFAVRSLTDKEPRVKWESAKVIGNIAPSFPDRLSDAVDNLLANAEHTGTVVRWSVAFALSEILKLGTKLNKKLLPAMEDICGKEEKNSIRKIYADALKKSQ